MEGDGQASAPMLRGRLFSDGSCTTNLFPELRRAATAIVQRRPDGGRGWTIQCTVPPPLPQTPQAAEFAALGLIQRFSHPTDAADVAIDCLGVVRAYNGPVAAAVRHSRPYAAIMREALADVAWRRRTTVRKVRAHLNPEAAEDEAERNDAVDNGVADAAAKEAVGFHPQPTPVQIAELEASLKRSKLVVRTVAKVTQAFPPMPRERMKRPPRPRDGARVHMEGAHEWIHTAGAWRCAVCARITIKPDLTADLVRQKCDGPKPALEAAEIADRSHTVARTGGATQVLFCLRCGAFSARRAYGLGAACRGAPKPSGKQALARI